MQNKNIRFKRDQTVLQNCFINKTVGTRRITSACRLDNYDADAMCRVPAIERKSKFCDTYLREFDLCPFAKKWWICGIFLSQNTIFHLHNANFMLTLRHDTINLFIHISKSSRMKKFYTSSLMALAAVAASASAPQALEIQEIRGGLTIEFPSTEFHEAGRMALSEAVSQTPATRHSAPAKAPETATDWTSIGEGTYLEDLLTIYPDVAPNQMWKVDVETSASNPGWYRFLPYASGPIAELLGQADTANYLYINASDPDKVYGLNFKAFGAFTLSNYVPENDWDATADGYGTLEDGCITFGTMTWVTLYNNNWTYATRNTGMKLFLPGSEVTDYSLTLSADSWCGKDNKVAFNIKAGASIASLKAVVLPGEYTMTDNNTAYVAAKGQEINAGTVTAPASEQGIHSILVAGLDADGNVQATAAAYYFGSFEDDANWKSIGKASFTEGIYAGQYDDIDNETLEVEVEKSTVTPGRYRLVNPYAGHSVLGSYVISDDTHGHKHYIYIDATVADRVFIEASAIGVDGPYGEAAINSYGARYAGTSVEDQAKAAGYFGTYDDATLTITYPDDTISLGERGYNNGAFLAGNTGTKIVLPESAGVDVININGDNTKAEYFNLQGVRIDNPAAGQLVIKRQGTEVTKTIVR